ncbi:putative ribonuclease H-like domain-containing protein [Tanacetum coccineum]
MTGNKAYLAEYQDNNGGSVAFGGTQDNIDVENSEMEAESAQDYFVLPIWFSYTSTVKSTEAKNKGEKPNKSNEKPIYQENQAFLEELERLKTRASRASSTNTVNTASTPVSTASPSGRLSYIGLTNSDQYDTQIAVFEDSYDNPNDETIVNVSPIPTSRIHSVHPSTQILRDPKSAVQTRSKVNKSSGAHAFEELLQFKNQKVWILIDIPNGKKEIGTKWVYRNKKDERGVMVRNKARLVAQGHRQEEGINYDDVFAPVVRIEAIQIFLAFASYMGFIVYQMDVKSAFLYGTIDEEVYASQPPDFVDPKCPQKVYKVVKTLYDLHQAPRAWYATLSTFLLKSGYRRGTIDKTLFIKKDKNNIIQDKYVAEILKKFDFDSIKTASTLIETQKPLVKDEEATDVDVHLYRSMIGSLMYLTTSRPDIMFAVCACSRFQKQTIMATSTTEAGYVAAANCCGQVLWIQNLMLDYGFNLMNTKIYIDNESTICIVKNPVFHSKTKHIEIRHHFIRDAYEKKLIQVLKIHIDDNLADLLTKAFDISSLYEVFSEQKNLDDSDFFHRVIWVPESNWRELSMFWMSGKSKTINNVRYITAIVAGKPVTISEASIRSDLLFYDADGIDTLNNQAIFDTIQLMGLQFKLKKSKIEGTAQEA